MPGWRRSRLGWRAVSDTDTALSWSERLGLGAFGLIAKTVFGALVGAAVAVAGALEGLPWSVVVLMFLGAFAIAIWLWNALLFRSTQKSMQRLIAMQTPRFAGPPKPRASKRELQERVIQGRSIRLVDLVEDEVFPIIQDKTFVDCDLNGPAVLGPMSNAVRMIGISVGMDASADPSDLFLEIGPDRFLFGVIGLDRCEFNGCRFNRTGFAVSREMKEQWLREVTRDQP